MKTLVLRIAPLSGAPAGYPLELLELTDPSTGVLAPLVAGEHMPPLPQAVGAGGFTADEMSGLFTSAIAPQPALQQIGAQLYRALAQGEVGRQLDALAAAEGPPEAELGLLIEAEELRRLPWELLYGRDNWLATGTPLFRVYGSGGAATLRQLGPHSWPLRVLVVVAVRPPAPEAGLGAAGAIDALAELDGLCDAIVCCEADVDLRLLQQPRAQEIYDELKEFRPHVLHFIGHGGVEPGVGGQQPRPYLQLPAKGTGNDERWFGDEIRTKLRRQDEPAEQLRLVVLNACRTAGLAMAKTQDPWSLAEAFLKAGVAAVIGMTSDVADTRAAIFARELYTGLSTKPAVGVGAPIAPALALARAEMQRSETNGDRFREWAAPCLITAAQPASVVRIGMGATVPPDVRVEIGEDPELRWARRYAGRREQRYQAWRTFKKEKPKLTALIGPSGSGKSAFVKMLMERCALLGHNVRYLNMRQGRDKMQVDFLDVLVTMRWGQEGESPLLSRPLPPDEFAGFHDALEQRFGVTVDPYTPPLLPLRPTEEQLKAPEKLIEAFRGGLEQASKEAPPLVLVIDHLDTDKTSYNLLHQHLFTRFVGKLNTLFVLLFDEQRIPQSSFDPRSRTDIYDKIEVTGFPRSQWLPLGMEFVRRNLDYFSPAKRANLPAFLDAVRTHIATYAEIEELPDPFSPELLFSLVYKKKR